MVATESKNGYESLPSEMSIGKNLQIDTEPPLDPAIGFLGPNPARDGVQLVLSLAGVEPGAIVSVVGMVCSPEPAFSDGIVDCVGTVGVNGLDGTNNTISVSKDGLTNGNVSMGLIVDNDAPLAPIIDSINTTDVSVTGTAEVASSIALTGATCTNAPIVTNNNGDWSCDLSNSLMAGTQVTATSTDAANNTSSATMITVVASGDSVFSSGFE